MIWGPGAAWNLRAVVANRISGALVPISDPRWTLGICHSHPHLARTCLPFSCQSFPLSPLLPRGPNLSVLLAPHPHRLCKKGEPFSGAPWLIPVLSGRGHRVTVTSHGVSIRSVCQCLNHPCHVPLSEEAFCLLFMK